MHRRHRLLPLLAALGLPAACADSPGDVLAPDSPAFIVNGSTVTDADFASTWPFAAALLTVSSTNPGSVLCTGSVVAPRWVVTAAHCLAHLEWHLGQGTRYYVAVGSRDVTQATLIPVAGHHIAGGYEDGSNDIALLELAEDAGVVSARLAAADVASNETVRVAGWGLTTDGGAFPVVLRSTTLTVVAPYPAESWFYAYSASSNVCSGDSGGPALNGEGELVGVHSFVANSCTSFMGSGHTSVYRFLAWIREVTGLDEDGPGGPAPDEEAPVVSGVMVQPEVVAVGGSVDVVASASDAGGSVVAMQVSIDGATWHAMTALDGAFDSPVEQGLAGITAPDTAGMHDVCVRAIDSAANTSTAACAPLAVFDPDGGFVVGNGRFDSPAGALSAQPATVGVAQIGFTSRYDRGSTRPSGRASFTFRAGNFMLESSDYEFLVVTDDEHALLHGQGVVDGGAVRFSIRASATEQSVWVRVWAETGAGEHTIYDTGASVPLSAGRLVIQAPPGVPQRTQQH